MFVEKILTRSFFYFKHDCETETVYEFPIYIRENFEGILWNKEDLKFQSGIFGGVLLKVLNSFFLFEFRVLKNLIKYARPFKTSIINSVFEIKP